MVDFVQARFGRLCCRETIRAALHRLALSWQKAKKLLGRANPGRREAFVEPRGSPDIEQLRPLLDGVQRDRHQLVYLDEAHIHQDVDLGHGWGECGKRLFVASSSPGLLAKVSFSGKPLGLTYGLYFYNEGKVRLWPYPRANGGHTIDVLVPDPGPALYGTLRPYQKVGVQWLHLLSGLGLGACLADDMGLGKTIQVLSLLLVQKAKRASASEAAKSQPDLLVAPMGLSRDVVASVLVQLERHAGLSGIRIGDASLRQPALPHQQSFCAPRWPVPSTRKAGPTTTANGVRGNTTPRPSSLSQGVGQRFSGPCSLRIQSMIPTIAPLENGITQRLTAAMLS